MPIRDTRRPSIATTIVNVSYVVIIAFPPYHEFLPKQISMETEGFSSPSVKRANRLPLIGSTQYAK